MIPFLLAVSGTCALLSLTVSWFSYLRPTPERIAWDRHAQWLLGVAVVTCLALIVHLFQSTP